MLWQALNVGPAFCCSLLDGLVNCLLLQCLWVDCEANPMMASQGSMPHRLRVRAYRPSWFLPSCVGVHVGLSFVICEPRDVGQEQQLVFIRWILLDGLLGYL